MSDPINQSPSNTQLQSTLELKALVESLLFVAEGPVPTAAIAKALDVDVTKVDEVLIELNRDYSMRGIRIQRMRDKVQLVSAPDAAVRLKNSWVSMEPDIFLPPRLKRWRSLLIVNRSHVQEWKRCAA